MNRDKLTKAEKLLYDIAYSYLNADEDSDEPDTKICIDEINEYFKCLKESKQ